MTAPETESHDPPVPADEPIRAKFPCWLCFLIYALVFCALVVRSWRKWPDVATDYGLQLYIPWQLSTGKVLYKDIMYLTGGPLSQYFDALLFRIFGVSFTTLFIASFCLLILFVILVHRQFARASDQITALMAGLAMLVAFAFAQLINIGNYNYICPYAYETFHGLVLSVAAIGCLWRWFQSGKHWWAFGAGICTGAVFLTKPDLFLALIITGAVFAVISFLYARQPKQKLASVFFVLGFVVPNLVFLLFYTMAWDAVDGLKAIAGAWIPVLTTSAAHNNFYRWEMGFDTPWKHLSSIFKYTGGFVAGIAFLAICARQIRRNQIMAALLGACLLGLIYLVHSRFQWDQAGYLLGPTTLLGGLLIAWRWWQQRKSPESDILLFPLLWSVFAFFLLAKMGLFTRIWHYGFYLAMPASMFVVFLIFWTLPNELEQFGVDRKLFRLFSGVFVVLGLVHLAGISDFNYRQKNLPLGTRGDLMLADDPERRSASIACKDSVEWLEQNTSLTNTLAVVPEGALINYLSRRANPTPYAVFALPEILHDYVESNVVKAFAQSRPDYILLFHRDSEEFGVNYFGLEPGYGFDLMNWIHTNYSPLWLFGHEPLKTNEFGAQMLKRNPDPNRQ